MKYIAALFAFTCIFMTLHNIREVGSDILEQLKEINYQLNELNKNEHTKT